MTFKQVVAGEEHTCALNKNAQVKCWGKQSDPSENDQFREISAGDYHTCGLLNNGMIKCWGRNVEIPPELKWDTKFLTLSVGNHKICGITPKKKLYCWNTDGNNIETKDGFEKIAIGEDYVCAINRAGVVECWGGNNYYQQTTVPSPIAKTCLISTGLYYTCAITNDGLACWGTDISDESPPYQPTGLKDLTCVATPPNANDPNTEIAQIKETTNLFLTSNGRDYKLNCLAQKMDSVLKQLGYPKGLEGVSQIELSDYRRWTLEQTLACDDPNQGQLYVTTESVAGLNDKQRYYWLKPHSSEKLYQIGCQGLLDVLGFKHTDLTEENTINPRDYLKESINCRAGLPPGLFRDRLKGDGFGPAMVGLPSANFAISRYEITVEEYKFFATETKRKCSQTQSNYPVTNVSWKDATAYAAWLSQKTGKKYRLPTEYQWEYAARAGKRTKYGWGNQLDSSKANYRSDNESWTQKKSMPVGSFPPNAFGVYDMVGNVLEWTISKYEPKIKQECFNDVNKFVLRGGSFIQNDVKIGKRYCLSPESHDVNIGFRVVRVSQ